MKTKLLSILLIGLLCAAGAFAADITGKWAAEQQGRQGGAPRVTTFMFKQAGAALTGTVTAPGRGGAEGTPVEIKDGKVDGETVTFSTTQEGPNGEVKITYTGKIAANEITFTREGGMGGRGGGGGGRGPQPLVAKKVQ